MADPLTELASLYQHKAQPKIALPLLKHALAIRAGVRQSSLTTIVTEKIFSLLWTPPRLLCFLAGCPASSEWDRQWLEVQTMLQEGRLQEAKKFLQDILPSVRHNGSSDTWYAQVIYHLN